MIGRGLLTLILLALTGFIVLVLIGSRADFSRLPKGAIPEDQSLIRLQQFAPANGFQQELKLVGSVGSSSFGMSVAVSDDGNTAVVGAPGSNNADYDRSPLIGPAGAGWVFTRGARIWSEQGNKLVGSSSDHGGRLWSQGASVALSSDGNTAIVGGPSDNRTTGAAWVFARRGGVWTQEGDKLVGTYSPGESTSSLGQGMAVALSGDGNTAIVGGWRAEGAWVFTRVDGVWRQKGNKLVGTGVVGNARQGMSIALSRDGNTAILGGGSDNNMTGAAWVFTLRNGVWRQQGKKLVGTGAVGRACQGASVAVSADGNTALVGGPCDNPGGPSVPFGVGTAGAAWVFVRSGDAWSQQGDKLVSIAAGNGRNGMSVALAADGNTAVVGGLSNGPGAGAASTFRRSGNHWAEDKKLVRTGAMAVSSVALSGDGSVIILGASNDNGGGGAAWVLASVVKVGEREQLPKSSLRLMTGTHQR
jgi:hypothetical protein